MGKKITKMLSLDTAIKISGYAYFENGVLIESGTINYSKEKDSEICFNKMCESLLQIINQYKPNIIVIERPPFTKDPHTLIRLSEIIGLARGYSINKKCEFIEYGVTSWRKFVKDKDDVLPKKRKDLKNWDVEKFIKIFNRNPIDDNEADAVLIGLARINEFNLL